MSKKKLSVSHINAKIKEAGSNWVAGQTSVSRLSKEKQQLRLGLDVSKQAIERMTAAIAKETRAAGDIKFASACDWRDRRGQNWITPVKDQGNCGSCVAFGTNATIESQAKIQYDEPVWDVNLSEADLFFCGAGRNCTTGWNFADALNYARNRGVAEESCFPYIDEDVNCALCRDKYQRMMRIGRWNSIYSVDERKAWLDEMGPLVAGMAVYQDFFSYKEGVYEHVTGNLAGYHAVSCIGYDEREQCWICKNSWGTDWGMEGFFKIKYGEAYIDTGFPMYSTEDITSTLQPPVPDEEFNYGWAEYLVLEQAFGYDSFLLWAYVNGKWVYKDGVSAEELETIMGIGTVKVYYDYRDRIQRMYGWKKCSRSGVTGRIEVAEKAYDLIDSKNN